LADSLGGGAHPAPRQLAAQQYQRSRMTTHRFDQLGHRLGRVAKEGVFVFVGRAGNPPLVPQHLLHQLARLFRAQGAQLDVEPPRPKGRGQPLPAGKDQPRGRRRGEDGLAEGEDRGERRWQCVPGTGEQPPVKTTIQAPVPGTHCGRLITNHTLHIIDHNDRRLLRQRPFHRLQGDGEVGVVGDGVGGAIEEQLVAEAVEDGEGILSFFQADKGNAAAAFGAPEPARQLDGNGRLAHAPRPADDDIGVGGEQLPQGEAATLGEQGGRALAGELVEELGVGLLLVEDGDKPVGQAQLPRPADRAPVGIRLEGLLPGEQRCARRSTRPPRRCCPSRLDRALDPTGASWPPGFGRGARIDRGARRCRLRGTSAAPPLRWGLAVRARRVPPSSTISGAVNSRINSAVGMGGLRLGGVASVGSRSPSAARIAANPSLNPPGPSAIGTASGSSSNQLPSAPTVIPGSSRGITR